MRILRRLIVAFFILVLAGFAVWRVMWYMNNDTTAPVMSCSSESFEVSIDVTDEELKAGVTATDNRDGDVSDSIVVVSLSKFSSTGKRKINYAAFDSQSNVATLTRTLVYTDYHSPRFSLQTPLRFLSTTSEYNLLDLLTAEDCLDGDISNLIKLFYDTEEVAYYGSAGKQKMTFSVTNSAGDTSSIDLYLELLDSDDYYLSYPALSEYLVYLEPGQALNPEDYIVGYAGGDSSVTRFSDKSSYSAKDVKADDSAVDYSSPGVYPVTYTLYNEKEAQGSVTQYIVVEGEVTANAD